MTGVSAEVGVFDALWCLAWHVAQRVQQAVELVSWNGVVDFGEEGRRSEVSRGVGSRGGVGCALLVKRGARGRLMPAATQARRRGRGARGVGMGGEF